VARAVEMVGEGRERAAHGVVLGDRAQSSLVEIRDTVAKTFQAVEETVAETARLQSEGNRVAEASQRVAGRVEEVSRAAFDQVRTGRSLAEQTREMARLAQDASKQAAGQAEVAQQLAGAVNRLDEARSELGRAHEVLQQGDADIAGAVAEVRGDAGRVIQVADDLSRTVDHLYREAEGLEQEVFRFRLPEARRGGILRVGVPVADCVEASQHFDPQLLTDVNVIDVAANFYSGLLRAGDGASVIPDLAESWEVEPNGHRYRFRLRHGVRFHDGRRLTASEVKASYERSLAPGRNSPATWIFEDVVGANEYRRGHAESVTGIRCLSDSELEIELKEPKAFFQNLLALPVTMIGFANDRGIPIGTGPFKVAEIESGRRIVLERNPEYFIKDRPLVDRQEMLLFPGPDEALHALNEGKVDVVSNVLPHDMERVKTQGMTILSASSLSTHFIGFSLKVKPFDDVRVRQAIRLLLDIDAGVRENRPDARPSRSLTPPGLPSYDESVAISQVDVAKARQLLAAAGFEKGLQLVLYGTVRRGLEGEAFFRHFAEAKVEIRQELVPNDEFTRRTEAGSLGMFQAGWVADYPDADNFLYFLCHSRAQQSYYNLHFKSEELDRCTEEARSLIDPDRRTDLYRRAEGILRKECPMIPIYHDRTFAAVRPTVHGLRLRLTPPQLRTDDVWVDEE
jgi:ABC-type transport system substrate-binding protein